MAISSRFYFFERGYLFLQNRFDDAKEVYQSILANSEKYNNVVYHYDRKSFLPYERLGRIYQMEKTMNKHCNLILKH